MPSTGDGEISFGGRQDVSSLINALEGAAVSAAAGAANNAPAAVAAPGVAAAAAPVEAPAPAAVAAPLVTETAAVDPITEQVKKTPKSLCPHLETHSYDYNGIRHGKLLLSRA